MDLPITIEVSAVDALDQLLRSFDYLLLASCSRKYTEWVGAQNLYELLNEIR